MVDQETRQKYLEDRRRIRARPSADTNYSRRKKMLKGDLKANIDIGSLEMNDYDVQFLHIPYGPGWYAYRINKLVYQTVSSPLFHSTQRLTVVSIGSEHEL